MGREGGRGFNTISPVTVFSESQSSTPLIQIQAHISPFQDPLKSLASLSVDSDALF